MDNIIIKSIQIPQSRFSLEIRPSTVREGNDIDVILSFEIGPQDLGNVSAPEPSDIEAGFRLQFRHFNPNPGDEAPNTLDRFEEAGDIFKYIVSWTVQNLRPQGLKIATVIYNDAPGASPTVPDQNILAEPFLVESDNALSVTLLQNATPATGDVSLWLQILKSTELLGFKTYNQYMNLLLCGELNDDGILEGLPTQLGNKLRQIIGRRNLPFTDTDSYRYLKIGTEAFVMTLCGIRPDYADTDLNELASRLVLKEGPQNVRELEEFRNRYYRQINGVDPTVLPYLSLVYGKLSDQTVIKNTVGEMINNIGQGRFNSHNDLRYSNRRNAPNSPIPDETGFLIPNSISQSCAGIIQEKLANPCYIELIWSYWMEEAMLVQSLQAISRRFQNIKSGTGKDPLAHMEISPLRLINNLLWGYIQDEQHRLSVKRRAYEYDHHYGFSLQGNAVSHLQSVDSRTRFLPAFHNLLHLASKFYKLADDTTVIADGFPMLNAIKELHLILSEGAHNQYGDLPTTARVEMLMQQWILARPEFREFLPTRTMVTYPEPWMDRVAAMNSIQGWTDASLINFLNLAVFGEQLILSIRFGGWSEINDRNHASNWANFWREQIQGYIHAYRAVTGIDLSAETVTGKIDANPPSYHLLKQLKKRAKFNGVNSNGQSSLNGNGSKVLNQEQW